MQTRTVDVAVIGAGTAGINARREVEKAGGSVVLIESGPYGTTCARTGCMPSKLLIAAADHAHALRTGAEFGVSAGTVEIDGRKVMRRVQRYRDRFAGAVVKSMEALPDAERLRGQAKFIGPTSLQVDEHTRVDAQAVVIATGAGAFIPPPFAAIREHVLTNEEIFDLEDLPASMAIIGTGVIGLELGQALHRLGVKVALFGRSEKLGANGDPEVQAAMHEAFSAELDLRLHTEITAATPVAGGVELEWRQTGGAGDAASPGTTGRERFATVLIAAGRRPNLAGLNLEATGLQLDERGVPERNPQTTQCGDLPIFMAGDVSNYIPLLHEASDEGRIAGANAIRYPAIEPHIRRTPLAITFTDPQAAAVGMHFQDMDPEHTVIGSVSFARQGRALVNGTNQGILRVYADRADCRLLGAEMLAPQAEHMAHLLAWVIQQELTLEQILKLPVYHPVLEEGMRAALRDAAKQLKLKGGCRQNTLAPGD